MPDASTIRLQIESTLARKIPSALTPPPKIVRPVSSTGIETLDELLNGGLPVGAISELVGPECSGRTSVALSFLSRITQGAKVCAWVDVSNAFDPASAAAAGINLARLLWVRCGAVQKSVQRAGGGFSIPEKFLVPPPEKKGLHGGGFGPHPRGEVKGLSEAIGGFLRPEATAPRSGEPQRRIRQKQETLEWGRREPTTNIVRPSPALRPWSRIEQALRATDLLLQGGGFSAIVLDMGGLAPEFVSRVPLATWFRYRAAAERTQSSILLVAQFACAKSSAELLLRFQPADALRDEATVFTGIKPHVEVARRFTEVAGNVIPLRKPPQSINAATWHSCTAWAGRR
ncbi:DNA recombination/repair protein RecA [Edaphobacter bradus]|uniref:DNA recombination/repair protein RecA n=1 Tax=Edaphobacter bradus TaxID=2259016 RepID=UPI0021E0099F|nr:DNA recombination/repair protein RecA [Edaphobacter bradus]